MVSEMTLDNVEEHPMVTVPITQACLIGKALTVPRGQP